MVDLADTLEAQMATATSGVGINTPPQLIVSRGFPDQAVDAKT